MKTIQQNIYTIDELEPKVRDKVIQKWRDNDDMPFMSEYMKEYLTELLEENDILCHNVKIYYSLSHSQGDGAMFEGTFTYNNHDITVKQRGHYYHAWSKDIGAPTMSEREYKDFDEMYVGICKKLEKAGYAYMDSESDEENIIENIRANEHGYYKDGTKHRD